MGRDLPRGRIGIPRPPGPVQTMRLRRTTTMTVRTMTILRISFMALS
jgi:hypothetical protein